MAAAPPRYPGPGDRSHSDVHFSDQTKLYDGRGNELNEGGMAVTAGVELSVGREVAVEFTPPFSGIPIRVRAAVRNRAGYRYGVEFLMENREETETVNQQQSLLQSTEPAVEGLG